MFYGGRRAIRAEPSIVQRPLQNRRRDSCEVSIDKRDPSLCAESTVAIAPGIEEYNTVPDGAVRYPRLKHPYLPANDTGCPRELGTGSLFTVQS